MAEENHENFSNFDPISAFGLERPEGENQTKPTNENNSLEEDRSNKERQHALVESKDRS